MPNHIHIRETQEPDLASLAYVHQCCFPRQGHSNTWLESNFRAFPRIRLFTAEDQRGVVGYIQWSEKSGFRQQAVVELEQMAILPAHQAQGMGYRLIIDSLSIVKQRLQQRGSTLLHCLVTTRADNRAQRLYRKALGAEVEATLANLYSANEVIMIARNVGERV